MLVAGYNYNDKTVMIIRIITFPVDFELLFTIIIVDNDP